MTLPNCKGCVKGTAADRNSKILLECSIKEHSWLKPCWLQIVLVTKAAQYGCVRAAAVYKKIFTHLLEQAEIAFEVRCTAITCKLMRIQS